MDAENFVEWLINYPGIVVVGVTPEISILAGKIRKEARISLIDCFILATAKTLKSRPLFLKPEKEMEKYLETLKEEYNICFLSEIESLREPDSR